MKYLLYILSLCVAICCTPGEDQEVDYSTFERVPLQSKIKNVQPMTGIVLWNTNGWSNSGKDKIQLEYSYMLYNDVCKGKDVYDWTEERSADYEDRKRKPFYKFATVKIEED